MSNQLTIADYEEAFKDHQRLVRELDVALNGAGAAKQASLCDILSQVKALKRPARLSIGMILVEYLNASEEWSRLKVSENGSNSVVYFWQYISKKYPNGIIVEGLV